MIIFTNYELMEYLNKYTQEEKNRIIEENAMTFIFNRITNNLELFSKEYIQNRACYLRNLNAICNLKNILKKFNMFPVFFKGIILAEQLYKNPFDRMVADIDLIVPNTDIRTITQILIHNDFNLKSEKELNNKHHRAFIYRGVEFEVHLHIFNSIIEIDESFILSNFIEYDIHGDKVYTFNITAALLHLIYHLYMDTHSIYRSLYNILVNKSLCKAHRFLYRSYEIALFSEKYFDEIKWDEIITDIKKQKLHVTFKIMINDIIKIFPNAFTEYFIDTVNNMEFISDEIDMLYKCMSDSNGFYANMDEILSGFINFQWNNRASKNIYIDSAGEFTLDNPIVKEPEINGDYQLNCTVQVKKIINGIKLKFKISNDDFCFSETKNYDAQKSDGVHLIVCGTEKYSYNSIFLFPKVVDNKTIIVPVNILNGVNSEINDLLISTYYEEFKTEYIITAILKNEFFKINNIKEYFYLGLVISDCSNKTKNRKSELILSNPYSEWANPIYFAKIKIG